MTTTCPNGHASSTTDYCDQCGAPIAAQAAAPASTQQIDAASSEEEFDTSAAALRQPCPQCGSPRTGNDRYCEACGYDYVSAPPVAGGGDAGGTAAAGTDAGGADAAAAAWEAVATADRGRFDRLAPAGVEFPAGYTNRRFQLTGSVVRIGRDHGGGSGQAPEINLAGAPEDPAISHLHAALERQDDGSYKLRDLGSTNGTTINDEPTPIPVDGAVSLADGDRIQIGAWTTITLRKI